jgi:hypothetical protein
LRIGKQPYGILPVTSLNAWKPQIPQESQSKREVALQDFLIRLRDLWRRNYPEVPRLGRSEDIEQAKGIDKDLAEVLSMDGLSSSYSMRNLMGRHYLEHLWIFLSADYFLDVWDPTIEELPPEPEPPEEEEPPTDLTPRARIAWIKAAQQARLAFERQHRQWLALARAREQRIASINAKRASTLPWWATQEQRTATVLQSLGSGPRATRN